MNQRLALGIGLFCVAVTATDIILFLTDSGSRSLALLLLPFVVVVDVVSLATFAVAGRRSQRRSGDANRVGVEPAGGNYSETTALFFRVARGMSMWAAIGGVIAGVVSAQALASGMPFTSRAAVLWSVFVVFGIGGSTSLVWILRHRDVHGRPR